MSIWDAVRVPVNEAVDRLHRNDPQLLRLDLSINSIDGKGVAHLSEALKHNTTLTHLVLNFNSIGPEGAAHLSEALKRNTTLTHLDLGTNCIRTEGAAHLSKALKHNTTLARLDLSFNAIGAEGAAHFSDALKDNKTLTHFVLGFNSIGAEGAAHLSEALKQNTTLTLLNVNSNCIGAEGVAHLGEALKCNSSLTYLFLNFNSIGVEGAAHLHDALKHNTTLALLDLANNKMPDGVRKRLETLTTQTRERAEARRRTEVKQKEEAERAQDQKEEIECRALGSLVNELVLRVNAARQYHSMQGFQANSAQCTPPWSAPALRTRGTVATSSAINGHTNHDAIMEEQLLQHISELMPRLTGWCRGWRDPRALEPVSSCICLERDYDHHQQRIRDAVHDATREKEEEDTYSGLVGLVAERTNLGRRLIKQAEQVQEWAQHGGQHIERGLAEVAQLAEQDLPGIRRSVESLDHQRTSPSRNQLQLLSENLAITEDYGDLRQSVVSGLAGLKQELRERAEALRKEDSKLLSAIEAATEVAANALTGVIKCLVSTGDMVPVRDRGETEHSGLSSTSAATSLVELNRALNKHDRIMRSDERTKRRHELLNRFYELMPQILLVLEHQQRALLQVHHFIMHIERRKQELLKWMPITNDNDSHEEKNGHSGKHSLRYLRPEALVDLIDSVWDARDDSQEAQHELERVLLELRQQRRRAPRRERRQQRQQQVSSSDETPSVEWSARLEKLQREASAKASHFDSLVSELARTAVAHFPELLVKRNPPSASPAYAHPYDDDEEEEESALWHLLHEVCDSGGLVVPGRQLHHYTDIEHLATAGQDARHDVLRARLLLAPTDGGKATPSSKSTRSTELRVLKRYALAESATTNRSSTSTSIRSNSDNRSMRRFLREARLLHSMEHPNIAHITAVFFDHGLTINTLLPPAAATVSGSLDVHNISSLQLPARVASAFIEMPFYAGGTLDQWLERNREVLSMEKLKALSCELLRAIEYLHTHGVVHCDVKPQNVLMTSEGLDGSVRLSDFDVSQDNDGRARALATATMHERTVAITLNYAAPELLHRQLGHSPAGSTSSSSSSSAASSGGEGYLSRGAATWASDMFSVGVVLVHMFFGPKWLPSMAQLISSQPLALPTLDQAASCLMATVGAHAATSGRVEKRQDDNGQCEQVAQLLDLLTGLLRIDPTTRTTATQALSHAFFTRIALTERVAECVICRSTVLEMLGVKCHAPPSPFKNKHAHHFTCNNCFDHHVLNESQREARLLERD